MKALKHFIYRSRYKNARSLPLKTPVDVTLELSSVCQLRCDYCYWSDETKLPFSAKLMSKDTAFKILDQASKAGVNSLKFNYRGEGTLNPFYEEITKKAKDLSNGMTFIDRLANTNFMFKNDNESVFRGLSNLTKVKVSYDSIRKEVFEKQRIRGDHTLITNNIDKFYNHASRVKSETKIVLQAVRTQLNADEDFDYMKKRWPEVELSIRDVVAGRKEKDIDDLEVKKRDDSERQPCLQAFNRLIFLHDGRVNPCCPAIKESLVYGSIHDNTLIELFNSKRAKILRSKLKSGEAFKVFDECKNCSSFESYKGYKAPWKS